MKPCNHCRLQLEELEQRSVPTAVSGNLTGTHALSTMLTAQLAGNPFPQEFVGGESTMLIANGRLGTGLLRHARVFLDGGLGAPIFHFPPPPSEQHGLIVLSGEADFTFTGTLTILTKGGTVETQDSGSLVVPVQEKLVLDPPNPTPAPEILVVPGTPARFTDSGTITGGTKAFKGASGSFTVNGTINIDAGGLGGTLTGFISGQPSHHGHGRR